MSQNQAATKIRANLVLIEWDGKIPPTQWYDRLNKMAGFRVRTKEQLKQGADPNLGVWALRGKQQGFVAQEGLIVCASESLARTIAGMAEGTLAKDPKTGALSPPANVMLVLDADLTEFVATPDDRKALSRVQAVLGKRGRKSGNPVPYIVTCMEELASHRVEAYDVSNCPNCSGTRIKVRLGNTLGFADPGGLIFDAWVRTRFAHGVFEIPLDGKITPPKSPALTEGDEIKFVNNLSSAPILAKLQTLPRAEAFTIMDAIFAARLYWDKDRRNESRLKTLTEFFRIGGSPVGIVLYEGDKPDWFDVAGPLGPEKAAALAYRDQQTCKTGVEVLK